MPILRNVRHETFAQGVARGMTASAAYLAAGFGDATHASRPRAAPAVSERIEELCCERDDARRREISREYLAMEELAEQEKLLERLTPAHLVSRLLAISSREDLKGPLGAREARVSLLEAFRIIHMAARSRQVAAPAAGAERLASAAPGGGRPEQASLSHFEPEEAGKEPER